MIQPAPYDNCKGCSVSARLAPGEVERILADYLADHPALLVDDMVYAMRLEVCGECPDLLYGNTCRHCGCLVAVRAKLAGKECPADANRWARTN